MLRTFKIGVLTLLLQTTALLTAQNKGFVIPDSLKRMSYEELNLRFVNNLSNELLSRIYVKTIIEKGKKEKNLEIQGKGYIKLGFIEKNDSLKLNYYNKSIEITKGKKIKGFPENSYYVIGEYYYNKNDFKNSLNYYLKALNISKLENNKPLEYTIKNRLGVLKYDLGEYDESLELLKDCDKYFSNNIDNSIKIIFFSNLTSLSNSYIRQGKLDSARLINEKGIRKSKEINNGNDKTIFLFNNCIIDFKEKDYRSFILNKVELLDYYRNNLDYKNIANLYYYIGTSHYYSNQKEIGVKFLLKMDSIYKTNPYFLYDERKGYDILIDYYKEKNNYKTQLEFIEQTIKIDNFQFKFEKEMRKEIITKYDTPLLLIEKENIINKLNNKTTSFKIIIAIGLVLIMILIFFFIIQRRNLKQSQKRFKELIDQIDNKKIEPKKETATPLLNDNLSTVLKHRILKFEENKLYRNSEINIINLAKDLKTNTTYLSKFINAEYNCNFSQYLNELRINDAIHTLKNDEKLRNYTIKAIAETFGYNNAESFSKAFLNKTGIYPSFYIQELNKDSNAT